jgi:hypothetical protein
MEKKASAEKAVREIRRKQAPRSQSQVHESRPAPLHLSSTKNFVSRPNNGHKTHCSCPSIRAVNRAHHTRRRREFS